MFAETRPFIIDIEASGLGSHSYPIEVGVITPSGERFCSLIKPCTDWTHWDKQAEQIHRIARDILETYGQPLADVAHQLNALLENQTIYTDGWVVDNPWLNQLFFAAGVTRLFRCSALEMILTEAQMTCWQQVKEGILQETSMMRHRASVDAMVIQETYFRTGRLKKNDTKRLH